MKRITGGSNLASRVPEATAISPKGAVLRGVPGAVTECSRARAEVRRSISRTYLEAHHQRKPSRDASPRQWRRVPRVGSICSQTPCSQTPCSQTLCSQTLCTQTLSPAGTTADHSIAPKNRRRHNSNGTFPKGKESYAGLGGPVVHKPYVHKPKEQRATR